MILIHKKSLYAVIKCSKCQTISYNRVYHTKFDCKKCNTKDIEGKIMCEEPISAFIPIILRKMLTSNEVTIIAPDREFKDYSVVVKVLKDSNFGLKFEESRGKMPTDMFYCKQCATCQNCVECTSCGHHYDKDKVKCPKCKKTDRRPSFIKNKKKIGNKFVCSFCDSQNIRITYYDSRYKECPKCGSDQKKTIMQDDALICKVSRIPMLRI